MYSFFHQIYKYGASLLARIKHPKQYETGLLSLVWYYGLERIKACLRPCAVIHVPFKGSKPSPDTPSDGIAVVVHCFYIELLDELLQYIRNMPLKYELFISTDTLDKKDMIIAQLKLSEFRNYDVRVVENRGRDIAAKFITFRDVYPNYRYFVHLHGKKSAYLGPWGENWRRYLLSNLMGSPEIISSIFIILNHPKVGLVFPEPFEFNIPQLRWDNNFEKASYLAQRLNISISKGYCPHFPVGSMFWGKTQAIQPLLDLHLQFTDFSNEHGQRNGELEHAIERMIGLVANAQGFYGQRISNQKTRRVLEIRSSEELSEVITRCAQIDRFS